MTVVVSLRGISIVQRDGFFVLYVLGVDGGRDTVTAARVMTPEEFAEFQGQIACVREAGAFALDGATTAH